MFASLDRVTNMISVPAHVMMLPRYLASRPGSEATVSEVPVPLGRMPDW